MARKAGLCLICGTSRVGDRRKSIALKPHGVLGGLPCSQCGNTTVFREYDPKKEPSPYNRYTPKPKVNEGAAREDLAWEDHHDE